MKNTEFIAFVTKTKQNKTPTTSKENKTEFRIAIRCDTKCPVFNQRLLNKLKYDSYSAKNSSI